VAEVGLADASDVVVLDYAREEGRVIVTLDADFNTLLALTGATFPSVVRVRIEGLRAEVLAKLLTSVLEICERDLGQGALVSVTETAVRVRHLPLLR
jgi:predicted nuclease of predicted toxin-antitoxin system